MVDQRLKSSESFGKGDCHGSCSRIQDFGDADIFCAFESAIKLILHSWKKMHHGGSEDFRLKLNKLAGEPQDSTWEDETMV